MRLHLNECWSVNHRQVLFAEIWNKNIPDEHIYVSTCLSVYLSLLLLALLLLLLYSFHCGSDIFQSIFHTAGMKNYNKIFKELKPTWQKNHINSEILNTPPFLLQFLHIHHRTNAIINTVIYLTVTWCREVITCEPSLMNESNEVR